MMWDLVLLLQIMFGPIIQTGFFFFFFLQKIKKKENKQSTCN